MQAATAAAPQKSARPYYNPKILVYSPVTRPRSVEVFGTMYNFPARGVAHCICAEHNQPGREDNEGVHEAYEYERDDMNRILTGAPRKVVFTAHQVAEFLCSADLMGGLGFRILFGNELELEAQKREANEQYATFRRAEVEGIIADWEASCAEYSRTRPGQPPMRRHKNVQEAYNDRDLFEKGTDRAAFICPACSEEANEREALDAHIALRHPGLVGAAPIPSGSLPAAPPLQRVQPSQVRAAKSLLERAMAAGLPLSVADRKGLDHGDPDVIEDVVTRLAERRDALQAPPPTPVVAATPEGPPAEALEPEPEPDEPPAATAMARPRTPRGGGGTKAKPTEETKKETSEPVAAG